MALAELTVTDGIARVLIDRPPMNAFSHDLLREMSAAIQDAPKRGARAGILGAKGKAFSAGGDVKEMLAWAGKGSSGAEFTRLVEGFHGVIRALRDGPIPWVAAVHGTAAGGGLGLALSCDVTVVHPEAKLVPGYARIGLTPDGGLTYQVRTRVGEPRAMWWVLTNSAITGGQAVEWGMAAVAHADPLAEADRIARTIAGWPAHVVEGTRKLLHGPGLDEALNRERGLIAACASRPEHAEGVRSFGENRPPRW